MCEWMKCWLEKNIFGPNFANLKKKLFSEKISGKEKIGYT